MCGLCGFALAEAGGVPDPELLVRMRDTLVHRGPDDGGSFVRGPFALGFRRLSIIDVAGGHQPIFNETGDVCCVMNGEIYNYRELREELRGRGHRFQTGSDAEVIVHLYEEVGEALAERLTGMYAFAVVDLRAGARRLLLGRDRLGIKPLYTVEGPRGLAFASEPKALLELGWSPRELRGAALLDYLVLGYTGGEHAAWQGMRRLPPGHVLSWSPGAPARLRRYWDLPTDALRPPARPDEVLELLDRVVAEHLMSEVPLGAFLSGGIDSTAVVTSMARALGAPPLVCSVGFRERSHDELETARATAARLGARHETEVLEADPRLALDVLPWFFDEPHADPSDVPTYLVSRMARAHVTVALSGDGGDETFAGYRRYVHDVAENRLRARIGALGRAAARAAGALYPRLDWAPRALRGRTFLTNVGDDPARAYFRSVSVLERGAAAALLAPELRAALREHDPFEAFRERYERPRVDDPLYRAQYADFHGYLPDQILAKADRASMAVSLEVRVPLLDHRFVERFAPLPAREKVRGGRGKHAFREALRGRVPDAVLDGEKRGFDTPLRTWIRGPLAGAVEEAVEGLPADWLDRAALRALFAAHRAGRRDHGRTLWGLLVLERWRRRHGVRGVAA